MKNNISIKSAIISGFIGLTIGLSFTYLINWGVSIIHLVEIFAAIGTASFFASFGGNIAGQREILDRNKTTNP